ncbi:MAG TPA: hypothetical protein VF773_14905 [Verrucomicrobiae bacterium]
MSEPRPLRGLQLDRVVLLGRTFAEYCGYFLLKPEEWRGKRVLDVAGGVSSFTAEANEAGIHAVSVDPIYSMSRDEIARRSGPDLDQVIAGVSGLPTYVWTAYRDPEHVRELRQRAVARFLEDSSKNPQRYVAGAVPELPFGDRQFDLSLVSYLLFAYDRNFSYEFHRDALLELMRVTRGEARIYPTVNFEAEPSRFVERLKGDPACVDFCFEIVPTDFEFLVGSNRFLRVSHRG